ncbi:RCC1 domain-containing protein [Bradymonas sediminis]|uniref:Uncharacterized protein n=1 Tax=Bradymonas sediminis TaxID=1548548 RepID=A0A2Z4FHG9_9DELT|nr:hypothetical protein [Bradymonas sediminis]AWV88442.1 hypothetical protein DN745_03400 [Bradymonas sediminis]TDP77572.1 alpha-tubulin suppressor-like RCC1 family protein [Bradymonas sediminis]
MNMQKKWTSFPLAMIGLFCLLGLQPGCADEDDSAGPGRPSVSVASDAGFGSTGDTGDAGDAEEDVEECVGETDAELCDASAATCGELVVTDSCGVERTVESCGECNAPDSCGALEANLCGCAPQTDDELCAENSAVCGELVVTDRCNIERTVASCGECAGVESCGELAANQCGCEPQTDAELCAENSAVCGELVVTDRCGVERTVSSCGDCVAPDQCGDIAPNQCGCALPTVAELCAENNLECGETQVVDKCGADRILDCGEESLVCTTPFDTCGGGGDDNICGCTPTTCEESGTLCGQIDDGCGGTLDCNYFCVEGLSLGANHACALGSGKAKCWGNNTRGKLGDDSTTQRKNPVDVSGLDLITQISSGGGHTCALTHDQKVICWGDNSESQLGIGTTVDARKPGLAAVTSGATQVVTGDEHTCALVNGGVKCWGASGDGQIGNDEITLGAKIGVPIEVTGLTSGVSMIAAGAYHNCALLDDGSVQCWGRGDYGQLANLSTTPELGGTAVGVREPDVLRTAAREKTPVTVVGLPSDVVQITAGDNFSCARTAPGELFCWGAMTFQSLICEVDGRRADDCAVFPTIGLGHPIVRYRKVVKSANPDADDVCQPPATRRNPVTDKCEWDEYPVTKAYIDRAQLTPLQISDTRNNLDVAAGANHICARSDEADPTRTNVFCMGRNATGQLGDGTTNSWTSPRAVHADSVGNVMRAESSTVPFSLSLGDEFSCAIVEDNNLQCWGSNRDGQIGNTALSRDESLIPFDVKISY